MFSQLNRSSSSTRPSPIMSQQSTRRSVDKSVQTDSVDIKNEAPLTKMFMKHSLVKLPEFNPINFDAWFSTCESIFKSFEIIDHFTKFQLIIGTFSMEHFAILGQYIASGNPADFYENLLSGIKKVYSLQKHKKLMLCCHKVYDKNMLPSQMFHDLKISQGDLELSPDQLKELFWNKLDPIVQTFIVASKDLPIDTLLTIADEAFLSQWTRFVPPGFFQQNASTDNFTQAVSDLKISGENAKMNETSVSKQKLLPKNVKKDDPFPICFFHRRFRNKSSKCRKPCVFGPEESKK